MRATDPEQQQRLGGSISRRLLLITMGVVSVGLLSAGALLLPRHLSQLYSNFERQTVTLAQAMAEHCVAPLVFDDRTGAQEMLDRLGPVSSVVSATVFDKEGHVFAAMLAARQAQRHVVPPPAGELQVRREGDELYVFHPITHHHQPAGTLLIIASLSEISELATSNTLTVLGVAAAMMVLSALLAWWLQRGVTQPILSLAQTMRQVGEGRATTVRALRHSDDEIGVLYAGFNRMLDEIATRERERDAHAARLHALLDAMPEVVMVLDETGRLVDALAGARELRIGKTDALPGKRIEELFGASDGERLMHVIAQTLATGSQQRFEYQTEQASGMAWFEAACVPLPSAPDDNHGRTVLWIARDVTQRRLLESQLNEAQRMESLGRLAGGIAHDFNNILSIILGFASLLQEEGRTSGQGAEELHEIVAAAERASSLVKRLLAFSRRQVIEPRPLPLNTLITGMKAMLGRVIRENISMTLQLADRLPLLVADPSQIEQVLLNLTVNARDAMPRGGVLGITTRALQTSEAAPLGDAELPAGSYVVLEVSDNGLGMDGAIRRHIFEPFFTTKNRDAGTGLGLATVYGIVKQAHGVVGVTTASGAGTTFHLAFPVADGVAAPPKTTARPPRALPLAGRTVLVVEDEPLLLDLTCRTLRGQGHIVLAARNAAEAIAKSQAHPGHIDLLVTDVVMPGESGGELARTLTQTRPDLKVLFMSGYADDTVVLHGVASENVPFLQKPFTSDALAEKLREALGTAAD